MYRGFLVSIANKKPLNILYKPFSIIACRFSKEQTPGDEKSELAQASTPIDRDHLINSSDAFIGDQDIRRAHPNRSSSSLSSQINSSTSQPQPFTSRNSAHAFPNSRPSDRGSFGYQRDSSDTRDSRWPTKAPSSQAPQQRSSYTPKSFDGGFQRVPLSGRAQIIQAARSMTMRVLDLRRTVKVTKGGKTYSFSVLVVLGDKNGRGGLGQAKGKDVPDALEKATIDAYKNTVMIPITPNQTIHHLLQEKFKATRIYMRPAPLQHGVRAHEVIMNICDAIGIKNLSSKVIGSTNAHNVAKGAFRAMQMQVEPAQAAKWRGRRLFDTELSAALKTQSLVNDAASHSTPSQRNFR